MTVDNPNNLPTSPIADLLPTQGNLKDLTETNYKKLRNVIDQRGFSVPVYVWEDTKGIKHLLDGHQRRQVLTTEGWTEPIPYLKIPAKDLQEAMARLLEITSQYATITQEGIDEFIGTYELNEADVYEATSFDALGKYGDEDEQEIEEDEAPEVSDEPAVSKLGEIYQLGRHRVMCGDSTNYVDVDRLMNEKKSELLFTSPPYSDMREYNGDKDLSVNNLTQFIVNFEPFCEYQAINLGIQRKDNNINEYWNEYIEVAKKCGNKFLAWNVWVKPGAGSVGNQSAFFPIIHEWIFVFGHNFKDINRTEEKKTKEHRQNRKVRQADGSMKMSSRGFIGDKKELESVTFVNPELGEIRQLHPATFSVELPSKYIKAITNKDDIVCDPFLGSGTTLIACEQTDRTCYGIELDNKYVDVIRKRYAKYTNNDEIPDNWEELTPAINSVEKA